VQPLTDRGQGHSVQSGSISLASHPAMTQLWPYGRHHVIPWFILPQVTTPKLHVLPRYIGTTRRNGVKWNSQWTLSCSQRQARYIYYVYPVYSLLDHLGATNPPWLHAHSTVGMLSVGLFRGHNLTPRMQTIQINDSFIIIYHLCILCR